MSNTELQDELFTALDAAEILARTQISSALEYLISGQGFSVCEVRALVANLLSAYPDRPAPAVMRPFLVN
jgi:hypothetical protein